MGCFRRQGKVDGTVKHSSIQLHVAAYFCDPAWRLGNAHTGLLAYRESSNKVQHLAPTQVVVLWRGVPLLLLLALCTPVHLPGAWDTQSLLQLQAAGLTPSCFWPTAASQQANKPTALHA